MQRTSADIGTRKTCCSTSHCRRDVFIMALLTLLIVVLVAVIVKVGVAINYPYHVPPMIPDVLDPSSCPPTYDQHPLVLVSMDGFRAEYLTRGLTPTLELLASKGTRAPYMKPSYPTITFPNHYTVVTGLYPPAHGIIANRFFDPVFKAEFRPGRRESFERRWWGGEPIWKTVQKQGKRAATYFWPGSEVDGNHPSHWYYYNESVPFHTRVDKVLSWLDLPPETRPSFVTLYVHQPDETGHDFGPNSPELEQMLVGVDAMVKRLVEGLQARNILACVNLLVIADHGMAEAGQDKVINLSSFVPNLINDTRFWKGVFGRFMPHDNTPATRRTMMGALACRRPQLRVYEKRLLPVRWHMSSQRRVEDVVLDLDAGFSVVADAADESFKADAADESFKADAADESFKADAADESFKADAADAGEHGYDNYFPSMNALFVAHGPEFRRDTEVEAFQNIELYNLMCVLLGVTPAPNNGTWGALHHMLANPPELHVASYQVMPPVAQLPEGEELEQRWSEAQCQGDNLETVPWLEALEVAERMMPSVVSKHLPWGVPQTQHSTLLLLQPDYVTAYSPVVKLPLWSSYTVSSLADAAPWTTDVSLADAAGAAPWTTDVRIGPQQSPDCSIYNTLLPYNVTAHPLFPPEFSSRREYSDLPHLMSNALPFTQQLTERWQELQELVSEWTLVHGALNVVSGPVFDYDADTLADDLATLSQSGGPMVPTHMFLVVSRCLVHVDHLVDCPHAQVDSLAFVYPQYLPVSNCLDAPRYAREFSAKVKDVEMIAGLEMYPDMLYEDRVRLQVRLHSNIWGHESWWNRLRTNVIGLRK